MYTSYETRSLRPRATLNPDSTHLPRIYHYDTFAGTHHQANTVATNATPQKLSNVPSTPTPTTQSPRKQVPSTYKKMKTAGKAIHRLTTYWDVSTHFKLLEFMRKKNIVIVADHNHALQNYFSNVFKNSNTTLDQLRDEAARQYDQIKRDDPTYTDDSANFPSSSSSSHSHSHSHPSAQSIYEEKLEKFVKEDLSRLENQLKKLAEDHTRKFNELSQSVEQKTKSLEDQQKKLVYDSNNAVASSDRTEKSFEENRRDILSQIQKIQSDLTNVKTTQAEDSKNNKQEQEKEREKEKERVKAFSDLQAKVDKLQKDVNDDTQRSIVNDLQAQVRQLQADIAKQPKPAAGADNQKEIAELKEEIQKLQRELSDMKKAPATQPGPSSTTAFPEIGSLTEEIAQRVQTLLKADVTGRVDYALLNLGARIVYDRTSPSYTRSANSMLGSWWPVNQHFRDPSVILQQDVSPGNCWSMSGNMGHVSVKLAEPIVPGAVTIDHISPLISPDISSAPKEFTVKGLRNATDIGTVLGTFQYDVSSPNTVQTFDITNKNQESFPIVMLSILSNHGHDNYTCIYRFRVHPQKF